MSGWTDSNRRRELPADWRQLRAEVIRRDRGICQWAEGGHRCGAPGTDVDHIRRGNDHSLGNLRLLCATHHARKSAAEGGQTFTPLHRPPERHPGLA